MGYFRIVTAVAAVVTSLTAAAQSAPPEATPPAGLRAPAEQQLAADSPEWLAREYLTAVRERGFAAEADFMHPDEMARFQAMLIPVFERESQAGGRALMNATFGRDATLTMVRLADPADFLRRFSRVMAVRMPDQPTDFDRLQILGKVEEGEQAHVLARLGTGRGASANERLEIVSLKPSDGAWKLMISAKLEAAVRAMSRRGEDERPIPRLIPRPPMPESPAPVLPETRPPA
jgi:hypothetical protein